MQQESRGKGGDPMQASESAGLAPNTINDPKQSIQAGVKHFQSVLTYGNQKRLIFPRLFRHITWAGAMLTMSRSTAANIVRR